MTLQSVKKVKVGEKYVHYKNKKEYLIIALGTLQAPLKELDGKQVVIYQALYDDPVFGKKHIWVRPVDYFLANVEVDGKIVPRFELCR